MAGSLSRLEKVEILAAIGLGLLALLVALWSAWATNTYSELTSKPHMKVYETGLRARNFDLDSFPERSSLITCNGGFRLVNTGGAGSVLEQIEVTVQVGADSATQEVNTITDATDAASPGYDAYVGDILYTAYTEERAFPVVIEPYGVFDLPEVIAELEHGDREFILDLYTYSIETDQLLPPSDEEAEPISITYDFHFADGARESTQPRICTYLSEM